MKKWFRVWIGALVLVLIFGLAACGEPGQNESSQSPSDSSSPPSGATIPVSENFDFKRGSGRFRRLGRHYVGQPRLRFRKRFSDFSGKNQIQPLPMSRKGCPKEWIELKVRVNISTEHYGLILAFPISRRTSQISVMSREAECTRWSFPITAVCTSKNG